jgi:Flp pilus assembly pilin Flp
MRRKRRTARGQSVLEYALILGIVALVCIPGIAFVRQSTATVFLAHEEALNEPPLPTAEEDLYATAIPTATPTATPVPYTVPTTKAECKNGGWQDFNPPDGPFKNQGDCVSYVNTADETPTPTPEEMLYNVPETRADCRNGGWQDFETPDGPFDSQSDCIDYVNSN